MARYQPTQEQIFRRRRALALGVLLVLVILIWNLVSGLFANNQSAPTPVETDAATQSTVVSGSVTDCMPGTVAVQAFVGDANGPKASFVEGEEPMIWYEITNTSVTDCNFNVGARVTFFTITSGEEVIWTSKQCDRKDDQDLVVTLPANQVQQSEPSAWARVRSSETGCGPEQEAVPAGGASYHLKVEVNGEFSENTQQFLLN
jgi:hypothetical protein